MSIEHKASANEQAAWAMGVLRDKAEPIGRQMVARQMLKDIAAGADQLRGAVAALEEARALIETAEQDGYVSPGWREDARTWASTWADVGGQ
jgi:hypothetical protein